jgi:hypothetical protein
MPGREAKPREEEGCNSCHSTLWYTSVLIMP